MSVVAARKYDNYMEVCADNISILYKYNIGQNMQKNCKLYAYDSCVMGGVGCGSQAQLLDDYLKTHEKIKNNAKIPLTYRDAINIQRDFYKYEIVPYIFHKSEAEYEERITASTYMIVTYNNIFIFGWFGAWHDKSMVAMGAGRDEVTSDMINGASPIEAVKKSAKSNIYISEPLTAYRVYEDRIEEVKINSEIKSTKSIKKVKKTCK